MLNVLDSDSFIDTTSSFGVRSKVDMLSINNSTDGSEGYKMNQKVNLNHSPLEVRELVLDANKSMEASLTGPNLGSCNKNVSMSNGSLGSHCVSVHHSNVFGNIIGGNDEENVVSDNMDVIFADDLHKSKSIYVNREEKNERAEEELETKTEVLDESKYRVEYFEAEYIVVMKTPKKKKKGKNFK